MKIAGRVGALIGVFFSIIVGASPTWANDENCDFQALVTVKEILTNNKLVRLPKNAVLKIQIIEAAIFDTDAPVIADGDVDVSQYYFPIKFDMRLECEKLKHTIMPSFNIRVELDDKLLFINDSMHPFSRSDMLQKIELKKIY